MFNHLQHGYSLLWIYSPVIKEWFTHCNKILYYHANLVVSSNRTEHYSHLRKVWILPLGVAVLLVSFGPVIFLQNWVSLGFYNFSIGHYSHTKKFNCKIMGNPTTLTTAILRLVAHLLYSWIRTSTTHGLLRKKCPHTSVDTWKANHNWCEW